MEVMISEEIQKDSSLSPSVKAASEYFRRRFKSSVMDPSARWWLRHDVVGDPLVELEVTDGADSVAHTFAPADLENSWRVERRLFRLWDRLLGKKSERQQEKIAALVRMMESNGDVNGDERRNDP